MPSPAQRFLEEQHAMRSSLSARVERLESILGHFCPVPPPSNLPVSPTEESAPYFFERAFDTLTSCQPLLSRLDQLLDALGETVELEQNPANTVAPGRFS
jgi:hypothetical protein